MTLLPGGSSRRRERSTDREQHHAVECRHLWTTRNSFWGETRSDNHPSTNITHSLITIPNWMLLCSFLSFPSSSVLQTFWSAKKHLMLAPGTGCPKFPLGDPLLPKPSLTLSISLSFTIYFQSFNNMDIYEKQTINIVFFLLRRSGVPRIWFSISCHIRTQQIQLVILLHSVFTIP